MDIPESILPKVKSSSEVYGNTLASFFGKEIPVAGVAGDQQAATFGQMCLEVGNVKNTYGTGCFMLCNTGTKPVKSSNNLLTTIAWQLNGKTLYALEGSIYIAGAVVQWLRDSLGIIKSSSEIEKLASQVPDNGGVYFVPAFTGLGAPHWNQYAKGSITGLTRGSTAAHIARAALEGIAFQTLDVLKAMEADMGNPITELKVDGGAAVDNLLMQIQADVLGVPVIRPQTLETTALGVAYLAGLAVRFWSGVDEIRKQWAVDSKFNRKIDEAEFDKMINGWKEALGKTLN
jgi:glycerol kinase